MKLLNAIALPLILCAVGIFCCCSNSDDCPSKTKSPRYRITLFVQEVMDDGLLSYSRTYETDNIEYVNQRRVEFDDIIFSGDFLIEKIEHN